jgi:hypothetical protein
MNHIQDLNKLLLRSVALLAILVTFSLKVEAEVLFEGYYKVSLSGVHSGYVIQRYELDANKKTFTGTSFAYVRVSPDGKQFLNESIVAKANDKFQPLSYNYSGLIAAQNEQTGRIENRINVIDATFAGQKMTLKGLLNGKNLASTTAYPKGAFLSNFLIYLMLQNGFKVGKSFEFNAISEEEGKVNKGFVRIVAEEPFKGVGSYKIDWSLKDMKSISYISNTGNALATESPAQKVTQELVATPSEATAGFTLPQESIKKIFGGIPLGNVNVLAEQKSGGKPAVSPLTAGAAAVTATAATSTTGDSMASPSDPSHAATNPPAVIIKPPNSSSPSPTSSRPKGQ